MKPTSLTKLAAVSALALGAALYAGKSDAVDVIGQPQTITVNATLENDLVATVTAGTLKFSATGNAADLAAGTVDSAGVITDAPGTGIGTVHPASLVFDNGVGAQTVPKIVLAKGAGTFTGDTMFTAIDPTAGTVVDIVCGGTIKITGITSDETTPLSWVKPVGGVVVTTPGQHAVTASDTIKFGLTLSTNTGTTFSSYTGACTAGSFNIIVDY